jgi:2,3-bisphosphoglycerate-dependent phosphoglycerate mutase
MKNLLLIVACLILNVTMGQETTTIYMIRHAEKADDGTNDPKLSDAGLDRTKVWGNYFADKNVTAYYMTKYKRAVETATHTNGQVMSLLSKPGTTYNITMKNYDPMSLSLKDVAKDNKGKNIVIVGHSNTIPAQINALIGEKKYADMQESEYGNLYIIKITGDKISHELVKM